MHHLFAAGPSPVRFAATTSAQSRDATEPTPADGEQAATRPNRLWKGGQMRRGFALLGLAVAVAIAAVAAMFAGHGPSSASASSHSEAPLISQDPRADNTDLYAFVSPEDTNTVTIIANYIPLESPASGPNFPSFDDSVLYEIKIDNNGDGDDDLGYQFRFNTHDAEPEHVPLQRGPITLAERSRTGTGRRPTPSRSSRSRRTASDGASRSCSGRASDAARQHRPALDAELRRARGGGGDDLPATGSRSSPASGRSVLRRSRLDLRPGGPPSVQPVPPDPARGSAGRRLACQQQHALDRDPGSDRGARHRSRTPTIGIYASASRQKRTDPQRRRDEQTARATSSRSRGSAIR